MTKFSFQERRLEELTNLPPDDTFEQPKKPKRMIRGKEREESYWPPYPLDELHTGF